ncbi:deoxyribose-phosphate aldolase [Pseudothermotoga thermarum]|uniref:Deoxyribose-phosphate aldolase n=1 Tax=Pseudothermotoga thermarum DSM 5069 TaxID=688269 RepID=F7YY92_9THEM|nr:deoxyribose-phosphate aldolase [Pseudothermotoga thermarum]AEH50913.1 deoxyribose-phosphate aldolase [Pseudothermotoga thermarum DSM 5069]
MNFEKMIEEKLEAYRTNYKFEIEQDKIVSKDQIRSKIEHTLLKPTASPEDVERLCNEALEHKFFGVCVNPCYAELTVEKLRGTGIKVVSVVGFPLGASTPSIKAKEAEELVKIGVDEIDMVLNIGMLKSKKWEYVYEEISQVVEASKPAPVKVIIETCYLTLEEKIAACLISELAKAAFVKTSTGFGPEGAKVEDVHLMKWCVPNLGVKASGGIRTFKQACQMVLAGADRIGTSQGVQLILQEV